MNLCGIVKFYFILLIQNEFPDWEIHFGFRFMEARGVHFCFKLFTRDAAK